MIKQEERKPNQFTKICNMKTIIEGLNRYIEEERVKKGIITHGHLVYHHTITPNPTMKAYKTYKVEVWFIKGNEKKIVATVQQTARVVDNVDDIIMNVVKIELAKTLFTLVKSEKMEGIVNGECFNSY